MKMCCVKGCIHSPLAASQHVLTGGYLELKLDYTCVGAFLQNLIPRMKNTKWLLEL